jgi:HD-GYP domain-containing protein (c-di-GMP phosphodiesterase class II)
MSFEDAIAEIVANRGTQFQPELADAFVDLARRHTRAA